MSVVADGVNRNIFILLRSMFACLICEITVEISRGIHGQWALQCDIHIV